MASAHLMVRLCTYPDMIVMATANLPTGQILELGTKNFTNLSQSFAPYPNILNGILPDHATIEPTGPNKWVVKEADGNLYDCLIGDNLTIKEGTYILMGEQSYIKGYPVDDNSRLLFCEENEGWVALQLHSLKPDNTFSVGVGYDSLMKLNDDSITESSSICLNYHGSQFNIKRTSQYSPSKITDQVWVLKKEIPIELTANGRILFRMGRIVVAADVIFQ